MNFAARKFLNFINQMYLREGDTRVENFQANTRNVIAFSPTSRFTRARKHCDFRVFSYNFQNSRLIFHETESQTKKDLIRNNLQKTRYSGFLRHDLESAFGRTKLRAKVWPNGSVNRAKRKSTLSARLKSNRLGNGSSAYSTRRTLKSS